MNRVKELHATAYRNGKDAFSDHAQVTQDIATGFAEWKENCSFHRCYGPNGDLWAVSSMNKKYTTSELYEIYLDTL